MAKKPLKDILGPRRDDSGADYIRRRLRRRLELELGVTMKRREWEKVVRCLDRAATLARIGDLHAEVLAETMMPSWALEIEALLVEVHGEWRYEGRPEVLEQDAERATRHYAVSHTMDALMAECGFPAGRTRRTRDERLNDAAWFAVPAKER